LFENLELKNMNINEYQKEAKTTALYKDKLVYPTLGLTGEAGEIANKVKKILRDSEGKLSNPVREDLIKELGDVLWYVAAIATDLDVDLADVATANINKLKDRMSRNKITGSGDNR